MSTANGGKRSSLGSWDRLARFAWLSADVLIVVAACFFAAWARYDFHADLGTSKYVIEFAVFAAIVYALAGLALGPYRVGHVRGSFEETADLTKAIVVTTLVLILGRFALDTFDVPRSLPFTVPLFAIIGMFTLRFIVRSWRWGRKPVRDQDNRAIIFGVGSMGRALVRSLNQDTTEGERYAPVALIDDDPRKRRLRVEGLRVSGTRKDIAAIATRSNARSLIITATRMSSEDIREVSNAARAAGLQVLILPPLNKQFAPRGADLRQLNLEDLLGRQRIELDQAAITESIAGKRVLVTGAGGSIGSELCRQIYKYGPAKLILLDRDESAMHSAQMSLTGRALLDDGSLALCDIRDPKALAEIFQREKPEVVFHAAALKHLTLLEQFPFEGWKTNVLGTRNVLQAAKDAGVEKFVNVSTDKAAWPSSVLGYSKRLAERLTADYARTSEGNYVSVRFGNVLGSRGSVITAFTAQIERGDPVTVTHPDVERFFMLIPEACQLVLQASAIGRNGEVMVLAMGKPVKILDVANTLIEMSGKNIEVVFTGLRPGEKLSEQLFTPGEEIEQSDHELISHVSVPALSPNQLPSELDSNAQSVFDYMVSESGGHRDHDPSQDIKITAEAGTL